MWYVSIRILFFVLVFLLFFIFHKKHVGTPRRGPLTLVAMLMVVLLSASAYVPVENLFFTFRSVDDAFSYEFEGDIQAVMEGHDSAMVLFSYNDVTSTAVFPKGRNGWKLGTYFSYKKVFWTYLNSYLVDIYHAKGTSDYFILVWDTRDTSSTEVLEVTDNRNSTFRHFSKIIKQTELSDTIHYTHISDMGEDYQLIIDGQSFVMEYKGITG